MAETKKKTPKGKIDQKVRDQANELLVRWGYVGGGVIDAKTPAHALGAMLLAAMATVDEGIMRLMDDYNDYCEDPDIPAEKALHKFMGRLQMLVKDDF